MEKIKEFISSPKKTAILGLIGSIFGLNIIFSVYFIVVVMRLYKKKGNIRVANIILILCYIIDSILLILSCITLIIGDYTENIIIGIALISCIGIIINTVYYYNILFKKAEIKYVTNKVFAISNITFIILSIIIQINSIDYIGMEIVIRIISLVLSSLTLPYFYNYYNLLKGGN